MRQLLRRAALPPGQLTQPCPSLPLPLQGNAPLHIAVGALYSVCYGFPASPQPPFTALLHRLLQAGADPEEENSAGYSPLGKLLCCGSLVSLSQAVLDGVRALLAVGSSLAAAGGGRAWKAVLSAALTATGETEPWYAGERHVLVRPGWFVREWPKGRRAEAWDKTVGCQAGLQHA